jgi:feruloyl esterase
MGAIFDATSTDLSRFSAKGGKLIMFMGSEDPVGAPIEAINPHEAVQARAKGGSPEVRREATQAFLRLYMIPGMDHCASGPGATNVSTATRDSTPPLTDETHDMGVALEARVENHRAPGALIATRYEDKPGATSGSAPIAFQRPLCVYPKAVRYKDGPTAAASSFACADEAPPKAAKPQADTHPLHEQDRALCVNRTICYSWTSSGVALGTTRKAYPMGL